MTRPLSRWRGKRCGQVQATQMGTGDAEPGTAGRRPRRGGSWSPRGRWPNRPGPLTSRPVLSWCRRQAAFSGPSSERKVGDRSDRLDEASKQPELLRAAHLLGWPPGEVDERTRGDGQFQGPYDDDDPLLRACQVTPSFRRRYTPTLARMVRLMCPELAGARVGPSAKAGSLAGRPQRLRRPLPDKNATVSVVADCPLRTGSATRNLPDEAVTQCTCPGRFRPRGLRFAQTGSGTGDLMPGRSPLSGSEGFCCDRTKLLGSRRRRHAGLHLHADLVAGMRHRDHRRSCAGEPE